MYYMGSYHYKYIDGKVDLPRKFQIARKNMIMRVIKSQGFLRIELVNPDSGEGRIENKEYGVTVLEEKRIRIPKNRCFTLPESYLNNVEITEDSYIVVQGLYSKVEIYIIKIEAVDRQIMLSILNT